MSLNRPDVGFMKGLYYIEWGGLVILLFLGL
jgi:hypothetical protein